MEENENVEFGHICSLRFKKSYEAQVQIGEKFGRSGGENGALCNDMR